eukprot:3220683-Alexandrium_andersonii.AAC.1
MGDDEAPDSAAVAAGTACRAGACAPCWPAGRPTPAAASWRAISQLMADRISMASDRWLSST